MSRTQFKNSLKLRALVSALICGLSATVHADSAKLKNPANNHSYQWFDIGKTWTDAKIACESQGGYLATVTSKEENDWLINNGLAQNGAWLGASDSAIEGQWQWITGEAWDYTNWRPGEPNNSSGIENYLQYAMFDF